MQELGPRQIFAGAGAPASVKAGRNKPQRVCAAAG